MSSLALPEEAHLLFVCEGTFEQYLISELLQAGKLIVDASSVVDITRTRGASQIQSQYLKKVQNYKGDDSRRENFSLGRLYRDRYPVLNFYTHPEIEMLIIVSEGMFSSYTQSFKSAMRLSEYCMQKLKLGNVKSRDFLEQYWSIDALCKAIRDYASLAHARKGEFVLAQLLR